MSEQGGGKRAFVVAVGSESLRLVVTTLTRMFVVVAAAPFNAKQKKNPPRASFVSGPCSI